MVTVIATGFDGGRKRHKSDREATGVMDTSAWAAHRASGTSSKSSQRQRDEVIPSVDRSDDVAALVASAPRVERSVGEPAPAKRVTTYDADDLEIPSFLRRK